VKRFVVVNVEETEMTNGSEGLHQALEKIRPVRFSSEETGPSKVFVVDTTGLVQRICIL
jgi:hypothetical protein